MFGTPANFVIGAIGIYLTILVSREVVLPALPRWRLWRSAEGSDAIESRIQ